MITLRKAKMEDVLSPGNQVLPNTRVWTFPEGNMVDQLLHSETNVPRLRKAVEEGKVWVETEKTRRCDVY